MTARRSLSASGLAGNSESWYSDHRLAFRTPSSTARSPLVSAISTCPFCRVAPEHPGRRHGLVSGARRPIAVIPCHRLRSGSAGQMKTAVQVRGGSLAVFPPSTRSVEGS